MNESRSREKMGEAGLRLATWGAFLFAAVSSFSIVAYEAAFGIAAMGLLIAFASGRVSYRRTACDFPILMLVAADLLAVVFSQDRLHSLRSLRGEWIILFYPVFAQTLRGSGTVRRAYSVLVAASSIVALYAIWQMFAGRDLLRGRMLEPVGGLFIATGFYGHHLSYGGHILITSTIAVVLAIHAQTPRERLGHGLAALVQFAAVVASFARTAWAGFLAMAAGTALSARGTVRRMAIALAGVAVIAAALLPAVRHRLETLGQFGDDPRIRLWQTSFEIWRHHPVFGSGLASFRAQFPIYKVPGEYLSTAHPHNDILNIMVNSGLVGLAAFAFIWIRFFRRAAAARSVLSPSDPRRAILLAGMLVVVSILVAGMGQCFLTNEKVASLFWFVVAATMAVAREVDDPGGNGRARAGEADAVS